MPVELRYVDDAAVQQAGHLFHRRVHEDTHRLDALVQRPFQRPRLRRGHVTAALGGEHKPHIVRSQPVGGLDVLRTGQAA